MRCQQRFGQSCLPTGHEPAVSVVERVVSSNKRRRTDNSAWHKAFMAVPPSSAHKLRGLTNIVRSDVWAAEIPFIYHDSAEDRETSIGLWRHILAAPHVSQADIDVVPVPISTCIHENRQLMYGRRGVPLCSNGSACSALHVKNNQGPLHIYLMPSEQENFDAGKPTFYKDEKNPFCLLCIRSAMAAVAFACESMQPHAQQDVRRGANFPLAFCNMVDVPGGYKSSAMIPKADVFFHSCNLVNENYHALDGTYNPHTKQWRISQDALIYTPNPRDFCFGAIQCTK